MTQQRAMAAAQTRAAEPKAELHGGYLAVRTTELCMAWSLLRAGVLRVLDVRVWLACHEMQTRRSAAARGKEPTFTTKELLRLVGGGGGELRDSLRRLEQSGLMHWERSGSSLDAAGPSFATSPEQLDARALEGFWQMASLMHPKRKRVPLPRRVVRMLTGGVSRGVLATALGQLICCLYFSRKDGWNPVGNCKGSWIGQAFGLSTRTVTRAREHLERIGLLTRLESPSQWHLNRYGARYKVNLSWARTDAEAAFSTGRMSPLQAQSTGEMSPPESDQTPLSRASKNQKPTLSGGPPSGVCTENGGGELAAPKLRDIQREDLPDMARCMELFEQAAKLGIVENSYTQRLSFAALAEWVRARGSSNPGGLFWSVLNWKKNPDGSARPAAPAWHFVTGDAEEAVRTKLGAFVSGEPVVAREQRPKPRRAPRLRELSGDAQALRAVRSKLQLHAPMVGEAELERQFARHGWSSDRFQSAHEELEAWCNSGKVAMPDSLEMGVAW